MAAPWFITPPKPVVENVEEAEVSKPKVAAPKKPRKKSSSTTTKSSEK